MQPFDFEAFKKWCEDNNASPLTIIYGKPDGESIALDFINTEVYDAADNQLKQDVTVAIGRIYDQMKG